MSPRQRPDRLTIVLLGIVAVLIGIVVWQSSMDRRNMEITAANASEIARQIFEACERNGETAAALGDTCRQAEEVAEEPAEPIAAAPSDDQVEKAMTAIVPDALAQWCEDRNDCRGRDAPTITQAQVLQAVTRHCGDDACRGEDAPALTSGQVLAAVDDWCSANDCIPSAPEDGSDGLSAYQIWLNNGNSGSEEAFLASLQGDDGQDGVNGRSAYRIWLDAGNTGTEADFLASLQGDDGGNGQDGKDGVGIESTDVQGDVHKCQFVVLYTDGTEDRHDMNPLMCLRPEE